MVRKTKISEKEHGNDTEIIPGETQIASNYTEKEIEKINKRASIIKKMGVKTSDLENNEILELKRKIDELNTNQLQLVHDFVGAVMRGEEGEFARLHLLNEGEESTENGSFDEPVATKPQWSERTTGREVTPVDWIKMHYGRWINGKWDPDGLTQADISRIDRKLYIAYVGRIRRLPDENLGLPVEPRTQAADPEKTLEMKRKANRDYMRRRYVRKPAA